MNAAGSKRQNGTKNGDEKAKKKFDFGSVSCGFNIELDLSQPAPVVIRIYNQKGQVVRTLPLGEKNAGFYFTKDEAAYWDGRNSEGEKVASGIYFYTLEAGEFRTTKKMVIIR